MPTVSLISWRPLASPPGVRLELGYDGGGKAAGGNLTVAVIPGLQVPNQRGAPHVRRSGAAHDIAATSSARVITIDLQATHMGGRITQWLAAAPAGFQAYTAPLCNRPNGCNVRSSTGMRPSR